MGKRKYDNQNEDTTNKKAKETATEGEIENEGKEQPQKITTGKTNGFDIKHLRKELSEKQGQTITLTQFLQVCLNPDNERDYILEYLNSGGNSHEILRQVGPESKKNLTLATPAFHLFHLIILKVQASLPHMILVTEEACRYFLNTFMPTVEIMISENSGPRHRKIILKLFTSMVTLNPDLGIEVLSQAPLTPKHLQYILEKENYKEKDNVRSSFVHFMTSFLVDGHLPLIKALLEKQGLLALVIPGLVQDDAEAVLMFLNILKKNVIDNSFISKSLKLKTFSHQVLHNIFKIYTWKGPMDLSQEEKNESRREIITLLSDIILTLFTSHKLGLYFLDKSLGTVDANKNQNLYKALLTLKRPWDNDDECEVILQIVYKCLDLHRAIINVIEQSFEPQHSPIWERSTNFVLKLLNKLKPEDIVPRMTELNSIQAANFVRFITLPIPLLKFIQNNLGKDRTISLYCVKVLVKMLETLRRYMHILEMNHTHIQIVDLKNKLEYFMPKHMPAPTAVVSLIQDVINGKEDTDTSQDYKLPKPDNADSLIYLVDLLLLYNDIHPVFFETIEGSLDMKKILDYSTTISKGRISLLKFKIVSLWLTLDSSAISLKNPMFKDLFLIMLDVYISDDDNTWIEAKDTLYKFFKNTSIFENDEGEIHLMLYALRNSNINPTSLIGDVIEYVLENIKELTEYVRNQMVHFEITDEGSESCLNKLFTDLMENRSTEESVFLENKTPSPFIVGCMEYTQKNKDARKSLKQFLSVYVANLLHCNYSPELIEVLIGDSKLEVKSYVIGWTGQPTSLLDAVVQKDNVLKNISKFIIENEDVSLNDIFPCLEESQIEESDFTVNDVPYKVTLVENIDSSELFVWSKYLTFCTVRLTNMDQLKEVQQKKITDYFKCIISIARKYHMLDTCRTIILNLFKNPYFLKIYKPLDSGKSESNLLATKFLLQIISQHTDIVTYMNKSSKILKPYQQKNRSEIVKAFVKINKKKNLNCEHTINVLEVIGMTNEDDLLVLNQIVGADVQSCVKEDKEPSLVLEVLRVLIKKYSKSITLILRQELLKKVVKLYTDLLTNKDVVPNLTNLEKSLIEYFENKPHQVKNVPEVCFKQFFQANSIRKSTSQLASILLKFNFKFCHIFKEQMDRKEILSQRELTLPLGNAVIKHNKFLLANNDFLLTIFNEYKGNILKLLEKPHKAGQIYFSCWKFVRKLLVECMELQDCDKVFAKIQKYEIVDLNHINLIQVVFLKSYASGGCKKEYLMNYFLSMLNITTVALKEAKDVEIINGVLSNIYNVTQIYQSVEGVDVQKDDFQKITQNAIWQNFCKIVLKDSLRVKTANQGNTPGPQLLYLLTTLIKLFYPNNHEDIVTLFDMVTSHSEFLNVMLSHHSTEIKSRLVEFLYALITNNESVMKSQQIPVYLSSYHATKSPCDRLILSILNFYETRGLPVNEYKPYVFGDSAANYYAVRKNRTSSLWSHPTPNQILNLFEKDVIHRTIRHFPVTQKLEYDFELPSNINVTDNDSALDGSVKTILDSISNDDHFKTNLSAGTELSIYNITLKAKYNKIINKMRNVDLLSLSHLQEDEEIYDPAFLFPLLSHLLAPGSVASCFKLLRTGLLSLPVMALSSHCPNMRAIAYHVLHRFFMLLETETRHKNDKLLLTDFIETLRHSLSTAISTAQNNDKEFKDLKNPMLPAVDALYLARALMVSTAPFDPLYKPVNNFLIAKQLVDLTVVPDFLSLFHDSDVESADRRLWILDVIRDGTKTMTDVNVIFKTMCLKMIMDFYSSVLSDRKAKEKILGVLSSLVAIPKSFEILIKGYGLLSWLHSVVRQLGKNDKVLVKGISTVISNMLYSMKVNSFVRSINSAANKVNGKNEFALIMHNKDGEEDILNILFDLLHFVDILEVSDVLSYVKVYQLVSKKTLKVLSRTQVLDFVNKVGFSVKDCEGVKLLSKALAAADAAILGSRNIYEMSDTSDLQTKQCLVKALTNVVQTYFS